MDSSKQYLSRVEAILGTQIKGGQARVHFRWNSALEAHQHLTRVRQMQKELRLVKKDVGLTTKLIRSSFTGQEANVQAGFFAALAGRKAAGRDRAHKREDLRRKELEAIAPYLSVSRIIDEALVRLDGVKLELESWLAQNKL